MTAPGSVNGGYVGKMGAPAANGNGDLPALGMPPPASMLAPAAAANGAHAWPEAGPSSLQKPGAGAASEAAASGQACAPLAARSSSASSSPRRRV